MKVRIPNNWQPRPYQVPCWNYLEGGGRLALEVAHRRWGKDDIALHRCAVAAHERVGTYWHMLPQASQARKAIWDAINPHTGIRRIDEAFPLEVRELTRENEMFIRFKNGSTWQVVGSDNYDALVGSPPVGIVFSEWALAKPNAWAYFRPIWRENKGWAFFITTPRGHNHVEKLYKALSADGEAFVEVSTAKDTGVFSEEDLIAERAAYVAEHGESIGSAMFEQEYMCSFDAAVIGAIFGKEVREAERQGRVTNVQYDPSKLVNTAWDLGHGDSTSVWFWQLDGIQARFIDYYECNREKTSHYLEMLRGKGYSYDTCFLPHDADAERINADMTVAGQFRANGFAVEVIPLTKKNQQIAAASTLLANAVFDAQRCDVGLEGLRNYRWHFNQSMGETTTTPVHDWASHPADAFMTASLAKVREPQVMKQINYPSYGGAVV